MIENNQNPLRGITAATVLPFTAAGEIDWSGFQRLLTYCTGSDSICAVFVNGHAGESASLSDAERVEVIRFARKHCDALGKVLVAGLVADSTEAAIAQAKAAAAAGADVLTVFPLPVSGTAPLPADAALAHVRCIGEAVDLPLAIFQYPFQSGASYATETLVRMVQLPNVIAIKEGSDSMTLYEDNWRAIKAVNPGVAVLPSNFDWFMAQLAVGGDGILTGVASLLPDQLSALWEAAERNDLPAMRAASDATHDLMRIIYAAPRSDMYARIKAALQHLGMIECASTRNMIAKIQAPIADAVVADMAAALGGAVPTQRFSA